jgi:hypothetical protein
MSRSLSKRPRARRHRASTALLGIALVSAEFQWLWTTLAATQPLSADQLMLPGIGLTPPQSLAPATAVPPVRIPLGATEIASPGMVPAVGPPGAGPETCAAAGGPSLAGAPFDGGGPSASAPGTNCVFDGAASAASSPSSSLPAQAQTPLGATELDNSGLSSAPSVASPIPSRGGSPCSLSGASPNIHIGGC